MVSALRDWSVEEQTVGVRVRGSGARAVGSTQPVGYFENAERDTRSAPPFLAKQPTMTLDYVFRNSSVPGEFTPERAPLHTQDTEPLTPQIGVILPK